jgi:hypothetical protein
MRTFPVIALICFCICSVGCGGSAKNEVIGANDLEALAEYERMVQEQNNPSPERRKEMEAAMKNNN